MPDRCQIAIAGEIRGPLDRRTDDEVGLAHCQRDASHYVYDQQGRSIAMCHAHAWEHVVGCGWRLDSDTYDALCVAMGAEPAVMYRGRIYRIDEPDRVTRDGQHISHAALREAAPARSRLWAWLHTHGITRPSPSGPSGKHTRADRVPVLVRLDAELVARAKAAATQRGCDLRTYVEDALRVSIGE